MKVEQRCFLTLIHFLGSPVFIESKNLKDLQKRVKKESADIGLAFDGDADRCFLIDEKGQLVNPSALTSLTPE